MKLRYFLFLTIFSLSFMVAYADVEALNKLASRVTEGTSEGKIKFLLNETPAKTDSIWLDYFSIYSSPENFVIIEGNNKISLAVGLNHYLKNIAGIHICWNNPSQKLPETLPVPEEKIFKSTNNRDRYYLNYCTFSYSMPFWDEARWMQELDWMALHGINMALSLTGIESVWKNMLSKMGYSQEEITSFIPGPSYMAWWQMNNLEGWGGPLPEEWFEQQENLQKKIVNRMDSLGIKPIFPGFSGMMPSNATQKTGLKIKDTGKWCGFKRPGFLSPEDSTFQRVADLYYDELAKLYGKASYFAMDPFHEGGDVGSIDLGKAGIEIYSAMKRTNPHAKWVIQSWQANPRKQMIDTIPAGDLIILDLYSEKIPKWEKIGGYGSHDWLYCMLLNFGGNIGMHGRINNLIEGYKRANEGIYSTNMKGIGATPEGIENNPIMYELLFDLPWINTELNFSEWLKSYLKARYGKDPDENILSAWTTLCNTVYNAPANYPGEGTVESLICARPALFPESASTWGYSKMFYSPDSTAKAARLIEKGMESYSDNKNFIYDLIDIKRQANADEANRLINLFSELIEKGEKDKAEIVSNEFLSLILSQDSILSILPETHVNQWLDSAGSLAHEDTVARHLYRKNAAMLITVWGDSVASNTGGLHDYSHREWGGIIKELYYPRWKAFFEYQLHGGEKPDYYKMETDWVRSKEEE